MSIGSFLFEGSTPPPKTTASNATTQYPPWYTDYQKGLLAKADVLGAQPAPVYGGQRVADLTPQQQQAYQMTSAQVGKSQPLLDEAAAGYTAASNPNLNQDVFNTYKSPYISDVVNQIATLGNRNLMENVLPNIQDNYIKSGTFGASNQGDFTLRAVRDQNANILNQQTQALQAAEEAAMSNYQTAVGRQMTGASNLASLAGTEQDVGLKDIGALEAAGSAQQQQAQKSLDTAYSDWQSQTQYPRDTVNWISQVLNAQTPATSTSQVQTQPAGYYNPSPLQTFLGTTAAYGGLKKGGLARCRKKMAFGGPATMTPSVRAPTWPRPVPAMTPGLARDRAQMFTPRPMPVPVPVPPRRFKKGGLARCAEAA